MRAAASSAATGNGGRARRSPTRRAPAPNLVARDFNAPAPNRLWLGDITYVATWEGWLYLAVLLDAHSRRVVGWAMADHLRAELALEALRMALAASNRRRISPTTPIGAASTRPACIKARSPPRHRRLDEPGRGVLRQRHGGELLRDLEGRTH